MSASVSAPTLTTATPPASFAKRSWSFSVSYSLSDCSICLRICATRASTSLRVPAPSTMVVLPLSTVSFLAVPSWLISSFSRVTPKSSLINVPPVRTAMSPNMALRRSPKPGALTAQTFSVPRSLLTTKRVNASASTSSAMINNG